MTTIRKAIVALMSGLLAWMTAVTVSPSNEIQSSEWVSLFGVVTAAFLTWLVPNASSDDPVDLNDPGTMP